MVPEMVPASLMTLLAAFAPLFTAPSFRAFAGLACGFLAQPGKRTVCGMLSEAGLARLWPHDRAHSFFSHARWNLGGLGLTVIVRLPMVTRSVAIPVMAKLVIKDSNSKSRLWLARRMAEQLASALPGRRILVVADSAYADGELKGLPRNITWITRRRKDAALHALLTERVPRDGRG